MRHITEQTHLLLGGEVVHDVEELADLLRCLALDHVGDGLAANIKEGLDVEVVGGQDNLKQHFLIDTNELLVPLADVGCPLASLVLILICICRGQGLATMVLAVL